MARAELATLFLLLLLLVYGYGHAAGETWTHPATSELDLYNYTNCVNC